MDEQIDVSRLKLTEKLVKLNRCSKVVKGGRRFSFSALVVVGDYNGHIGIGFGKANEIPNAISKGVEDAKKTLIKVEIKNNTIPHEIIGKFGKGRFWMKPAREGTGLIVGGGVRVLFELAGISNVLSKAQGSRNVLNVIKAAFSGLSLFKNVSIEAEKEVKK